jgi:alkaline phosphatase D
MNPNPIAARLAIRASSLIAVLALCFGANAAERAARLAASPMVGYTEFRTARIWIQADRAVPVAVEFWRDGEPGNRRRTRAVVPGVEHRGATTVTLDELTPGTTYRYIVLLDGRPVGDEGVLRTQPLWAWQSITEPRHQPADFSVVAGSCMYLNDRAFDRAGPAYGGGEEILDAMAATSPDVVLWLGDNVYLREADYGSDFGIDSRYRSVRASPVLQKLLRTGQHWSVWDDHDYGPNDANASFQLKESSLATFRRYWANPSYGMPGVGGIFTRTSFQDVDFFLLDNRYHRDSDIDRSERPRVMFGPDQMRWLKNALLSSTATFKVIVSGGQMLNERLYNRFEGWHNFGEERRDFLDWLSRNRVPGVIFMSGDRHYTELLEVPRADGMYALRELTCSPLTAGAFANPGAERDKPIQRPGTMVTQRNFCRLSFSGAHRDRVVTIESHDAAGRVLWQVRLRQSDLGFAAN